MRGRKKQVLRYALVPSAPRRAPQNRVVRPGRRVGVLPTAARLYFPTLSDESSRQTAAVLLGTLPYPRFVSGQRIVFQTDWRDYAKPQNDCTPGAVGHQCVGGHRLYGNGWSEARRARHSTVLLLGKWYHRESGERLDAREWAVTH